MFKNLPGTKVARDQRSHLIDNVYDAQNDVKEIDCKMKNMHADTHDEKNSSVLKLLLQGVWFLGGSQIGKSENVIKKGRERFD